MDKPQLLINIQSLVPQLPLKRIQELAELEYIRQIEEIASGMLHKKHIETLLEVVKYMPEPIKEKVIDAPESKSIDITPTTPKKK
jgi:hypothetical protein